jgi:uncharacterized protein YcfL
MKRDHFRRLFLASAGMLLSTAALAINPVLNAGLDRKAVEYIGDVADVTVAAETDSQQGSMRLNAFFTNSSESAHVIFYRLTWLNERGAPTSSSVYAWQQLELSPKSTLSIKEVAPEAGATKVQIQVTATFRRPDR